MSASNTTHVPEEVLSVVESGKHIYYTIIFIVGCIVAGIIGKLIQYALEKKGNEELSQLPTHVGTAILDRNQREKNPLLEDRKGGGMVFHTFEDRNQDEEHNPDYWGKHWKGAVVSSVVVQEDAS